MFDVFFNDFNAVPDIVVAGAGIYEASTAGFWNDADRGSGYKLLDINLTHPIKTTRIAIRHLRQAGKPGMILHISSITAQKPSAVLPLYSVSKAAISQFVRCMAPLESLCGIRVVAVAPGVVDTPLFRDSPGALAHIDMEKDFVLPRSEIVRAMVALIRDATYPSGTILEVGDIGLWRPVEILNDSGPQGRSTLPRQKAKKAIQLVEAHLKEDAEGRGRPGPAKL
ncbi:uncharacterized protein Z518_11293 [Rhinocladiella mackenziei CBS 650.93]|uniref:Rhinocladiella mackenziei CBS 650.93 unplaced genomic scaffold supercont1.12, whole genome shotgun sequence n=1 Tax=Rhinocladiella mackenziei CBS 650.93 TaxID=1442369 RepID=A0A0D2IS62_9EURO|nr:uncharacterized protein Z518_11293 [Rhinocladiella mackenziei CBS 650.93]KIW99554.1 hypothetical protein Z518_11293 [Rhinocladiella mackenziei CBS 650.93]